jgi:hypothetical protein
MELSSESSDSTDGITCVIRLFINYQNFPCWVDNESNGTRSNVTRRSYRVRTAQGTKESRSRSISIEKQYPTVTSSEESLSKRD